MQFKVTKQRTLHRLSALNFIHLPCTRFKNRNTIKLKETERDFDKQRAREESIRRREKNLKKLHITHSFQSRKKNFLFPVTLNRSFCLLIFLEKEVEEEGR